MGTQYLRRKPSYSSRLSYIQIPGFKCLANAPFTPLTPQNYFWFVVTPNSHLLLLN